MVVVAGTRVDLGFNRFQKLSADYRRSGTLAALDFPRPSRKERLFPRLSGVTYLLRLNCGVVASNELKRKTIDNADISMAA